MDTCSLPKARPISCKDCPAFQRRHMSIRWFAESFTRLLTVINTTFTDTEKMYSRWCCIDRLSWQGLSECGLFPSLLPVARGHNGNCSAKLWDQTNFQKEH